MTDPIIDHIERQREARFNLERDFGGEAIACPECGSEDVSDCQGHIRTDDRPPLQLFCEKCGHTWAVDA